MKTKLLLAFSTALYKSLKYLPNTTLWIIGHYSNKTCNYFTDLFRSEKFGGKYCSYHSYTSLSATAVFRTQVIFSNMFRQCSRDNIQELHETSQSGL
jgi:hypothetical protein